MSGALVDLLTPDRFEAAWARVRVHAGAGVDGVNGRRFSQDLAGNLAQARTALLSPGYRPGALLRLEQPKPDGGVRVLGIPTLSDRVGQTAVHLAVAPLLDGKFLPSVHGYRPGHSPTTAIRDLLGQVGTQPWLEVVHADIHGLFDNLEHRRLAVVTASAWADPLWVRLNGAWRTAWAFAPGVGIPQGAPLSPLLANLYLEGLDHALEAARAEPSRSSPWARPPAFPRGRPHARVAAARATVFRAMFGAAPRGFPAQGGCPPLVGWIRYGDDLALVTAQRGGGLALLRWLDACVRAEGLRLSDKKTTFACGHAGGSLPRPVLGVPLSFASAEAGWSLIQAGPASALPWLAAF